VHQPDRLASNPLLRSRLVRDHGDLSADTLHALLLEAAESLQADLRDDRPFRWVSRPGGFPAAVDDVQPEQIADRCAERVHQRVDDLPLAAVQVGSQILAGGSICSPFR
jgi:hypothetical protein